MPEVILLIAKIPPKRKDGKSSFHELLAYCLGNPARVAHTNWRNIRGLENAALEMAAVAGYNVRCKDPVFHFILSWRELEFPTNGQVDEAVEIALKELDLQNCQSVWALQNDTENRHVHVVVNRIDPETGKAVQPAGNWTYKALERAARKIEIAQGWEIEKTGRYTVEGGELQERKDELREPRNHISQTARDIEAHTGAKSIERIGKETVVPIVQMAKSWKDLHKKLAGRGISLERKGSGAVFHINGTVVKASKIDRSFSLSKLEERFGAYLARSEDISIVLNTNTSEVLPVEKISKAPKVKASWENYQKARMEYLNTRKKAKADLGTCQKLERDALYREQKEAQKRLFEVSWLGKGAELNQKRSLMAAEQQKEKLNLRDRQEKERKELKERFPSRFPNFKTWLEHETDPKLSVLYRYAGNPVFCGENTDYMTGETDLRDYTPVSANKGGIGYIREKKKTIGLFGLENLIAPQADFIDYGRKILLSKNCDEAAILAAFQLASQKWGAVWINGTEEYKKLCVRIAQKHNFKIANPDLNLIAWKGRAVEPMEQKIPQHETYDTSEVSRPHLRSQELFEQYADAVGAERYRILATEFTSEGVKAFIFDKQSGGLDGKTREEIIDAIPRLKTYVNYNKNICVVPLSTDKHHILVDDMTEEKLGKLKEDGYSPSCVIESSPGNFQAVITVPKLTVEPQSEREAANQLVRELNRQYGDPKLSGAVHAHRLPPFPNLKPKHRKEDGMYPETTLVEANGGICDKAARRLEEIREHISQESQRWTNQAKNTPVISDGAHDPNGAYWAHYRDIMPRLADTQDYSAIDGKIGIRMRVTGYSAAQIYEAIKNNAPAMRKETLNIAEWSTKYRSRDWGRYAKETVEKFVFGPRGVNLYSQAEAFRAYYMKVEGRNWTEEIRRKANAEKDLGR